MTKKHNARHPDRANSHYKERLRKRGFTKAPTMEDVEVLRRRQERERKEREAA